MTTCFFLFSFLHCFTHAIVQSVLYSFDHAQDSRVASILKEAQVPRNEVAWLNRHSHNNFTLQLCKHVPLTKSAASTCEVIFQSGDVSARPVPLGFRGDVGRFLILFRLIDLIDDSLGRSQIKEQSPMSTQLRRPDWRLRPLPSAADKPFCSMDSVREC